MLRSPAQRTAVQGDEGPSVLSNGAEEFVVGLVFLAVDDVRDKTLSERSVWGSHGITGRWWEV